MSHGTGFWPIMGTTTPSVGRQRGFGTLLVFMPVLLLKGLNFTRNLMTVGEKKTTKQLWDALFVDKVYGDCTDVLLRHPVEKGWVKNDFDKQ